MRFINTRRVSVGVEPICKALGVPASTYYARRSRTPSARARRDAELIIEIGRAREGYRSAYGVRKTWRELKRRGVEIGRERVARLMRRVAKVDLLILDDWAMSDLTAAQRRDLMEIIDDRHDRRATLVTSQLPVEHWHEALGDPTLADAILDRLVHNAYKITLQGESMRKRQARLTKGASVE